MLPMSKIKAVGYIRVSTEKQATEGSSLEEQLAKIKGYAQLYDLELVCDPIVDDGKSAKSLNREGIQLVLQMLDSRQASAVIVAKLDRLTRSMLDLSFLLQKYFESGDCRLISVSEMLDSRTAAGELIINILGSVARWERRAISERTKNVMAYMRSQGRYTGGRIRYGFTKAGDRLQTVGTEQAAVTTAKQLNTQGLSLRQISHQLAAIGYLSRNGKPFAAMQVKRMLEAAEI